MELTLPTTLTVFSLTITTTTATVTINLRNNFSEHPADLFPDSGNPLAGAAHTVESHLGVGGTD